MVSLAVWGRLYIPDSTEVTMSAVSMTLDVAAEFKPSLKVSTSIRSRLRYETLMTQRSLFTRTLFLASAPLSLVNV